MYQWSIGKSDNAMKRSIDEGSGRKPS